MTYLCLTLKKADAIEMLLKLYQKRPHRYQVIYDKLGGKDGERLKEQRHIELCLNEIIPAAF